MVLELGSISAALSSLFGGWSEGAFHEQRLSGSNRAYSGPSPRGESWPGLWRCVLDQDTSLSQSLSSSKCKSIVLHCIAGNVVECNVCKMYPIE